MHLPGACSAETIENAVQADAADLVGIAETTADVMLAKAKKEVHLANSLHSSVVVSAAVGALLRRRVAG